MARAMCLQWVFELASDAGFLPLLKALNGIVVRNLGVGQECVPDDFGQEKVMARVMEVLFEFGDIW